MLNLGKNSRELKKNIDEKLEVVQNAMLPIINLDLLLNLKDSKYVDLVVPNNPDINNNDKYLETVQNTIFATRIHY